MARLIRAVLAVAFALVLIAFVATGALAVTYFLVQDTGPAHHHREH